MRALALLLVLAHSARLQDESPGANATTSPSDLSTTEEPDDEELGAYLGSPCQGWCNPKLAYVFCDAITGHCECDKQHPVRLGPTQGCSKPVRLGEQCLSLAACSFTDQHAECKQINHNAICQCKSGYHTVALQRPTKRVFCSEDLVLLTTDMPTLFGVASGLAIISALICFVLKLFSRARYSRPRHYANANLAPPILFASETGIPLAVHGGRPASRASSQRSVASGVYNHTTSSTASGFSRRASSRGVLVPASRAGSRRPSVASIHSNASSTRSMSFSQRMFDRENQQREERKHQIMLQQQQQEDKRRGEQAVPTPSPRTPMSTDELLPSVSEVKEESLYSSSPGTSNGNCKGISTISYHGDLGPCTSSNISR